jgi:prepilin-type N-terminal cleavage/methylation domain-containing protein
MKQKGYTLLELLVVISITGFIVLVIGSSFAQIMRGRVDIAQKSVAMTDIDNAAHWLTRDLVLAQTISLTEGAPATSNMTLNWSDRTAWAADEGTVMHSVNYALSGTRLLRNYDGEVSTIGRYLTTANFSIDGKVFTITLTSRPGQPGSTVTRNYEIEMRYDLP